MAARASFCLEDGMFTSSCIATLALRMRVSMSAIGSVIVIEVLPSSPARLGHARDLPGVHELAQADAAELELAVHRVRPAAALAAGVRPHLELRLLRRFVLQSGLRHALLPLTGEREAEGAEQSPSFVIGASGRDDGDVHATGGVDAVVVDLREDQLLGHAEGVVAVPVERVGRQPPEVTDA